VSWNLYTLYGFQDVCQTRVSLRAAPQP